MRHVIENIQGDSNVPVTFCRAVVATDEWFQFDLETDATQDVLKLPLFFIVAINRVRYRLHYLPISLDLSPKTPVVEMTRKTLPRRVIDILNVDKDGYRFQFLIP